MALWAIQTRFIGCKNPSDKFLTIGHSTSKKQALERVERERKSDKMSEFRVMYVRESV